MGKKGFTLQNSIAREQVLFENFVFSHHTLFNNLLTHWAVSVAHEHAFYDKQLYVKTELDLKPEKWDYCIQSAENRNYYCHVFHGKVLRQHIIFCQNPVN